MNSTFQNSGQVLSIGIFFTLMIIGLSRTLPHALYVGLTNEGIALSVAHHISTLPPVTTLFASFLGYNPMAHLLGAHVLASLSPSARTAVLGRKFFPTIIEKAFVVGTSPRPRLRRDSLRPRRRHVLAARDAVGAQRRKGGTKSRRPRAVARRLTAPREVLASRARCG